MSQHSQRTQQGPSRASIAAGWFLVALTIAGVTYVGMAEAFSFREAVGMTMGVMLGGLLMAQTIGRREERQAAQHRARLLAQAEDQERQRARLNTGTWNGDAVGQVLTVRYDPADGMFWVEGWLGDHFQVYPALPGVPDAVARTIRELEVTGELEPVDDEGTRAVRARLDLPGPWNTPEPEEPGVEDTQRLNVGERQYESAWLRDVMGSGRPAPVSLSVDDLPPGTYYSPGGPSEAALRPIAVPVFRTEAERAVWAAEHDIPTEFLPIQEPRD